MTPAAVVKDLDVSKDFAARLGARAPSSLVCQFDLEGGAETLGQRVVRAVSPLRLMLLTRSCWRGVVGIGDWRTGCRGRRVD
jgi:hypothetical protein